MNNGNAHMHQGAYIVLKQAKNISTERMIPRNVSFWKMKTYSYVVVNQPVIYKTYLLLVIIVFISFLVTLTFSYIFFNNWKVFFLPTFRL